MSAFIPESDNNTESTVEQNDGSKDSHKIIGNIESLVRKKQYQQALAVADELENKIIELSDKQRYRFYIVKGDAHWYLWHFIDAEKDWSKAVLVLNKRVPGDLSRRLAQVREAIRNSNSERSLQSVYRSAPGVGPSNVLKGDITLVSVFVNISSSEKWSLKNRAMVKSAWQRSSEWLTEAAKKYSGHVQFSHRLFIVDRNPSLLRMKIKSFDMATKKSDKIIKYVLQDLGERSVTDFLKKIKYQDNADQVILLLHVNDNKRSFAFPCFRQCNSYYSEFAFIYEKAQRKRWQSMEYVLAHESLHLFGADDLYNIKRAKTYAPKDIMNYPSSVLFSNTLEDLTAYSVGLINTRPATPFKVNSNQR